MPLRVGTTLTARVVNEVGQWHVQELDRQAEVFTAPIEEFVASQLCQESPAPPAVTRSTAAATTTVTSRGSTPEEAERIARDIAGLLFTVTFSNARTVLSLVTGDAQAPFLCVAVTATNTGQNQGTVNGAPFDMVQPDGQVVFFGSGSGARPDSYRPLGATVVAGASTSGDVCFATNGKHGKFVIEYRPMATSTEASYEVKL
jgi:Domain of unknown function (DUF4352)